MSYSQKYCLVSFNAPLDIGTVFEMYEWPLHVTLADVFAAELNIDFEYKLSELLAKLSPVTTSANKESSLSETQVILLDKNDALLSLHTQITNLLVANGAKFNNPEFTLDGFIPHSTIQKADRINVGDKVKIDTITLVDMFPNGNWRQRKVLRNFTLGTI